MPSGATETFRVHLPSFPLAGVAYSADEFVFHPDIWITEFRVHLEFDGLGTYPAERISAQLFPNVPFCAHYPTWPNGAPVWNVTGEDLGWNGTGQFTADLATTQFNGWASVAHCEMPALNFWMFQITDWVGFQKTGFGEIGGQFTNSYFEIAYIPLLIDYTCNGEDIATEGGDAGRDCTVNVFDLLALLGNWGTDGDGATIAEPMDIVNLFDLLGLLAAWGDCPVRLP